MPKPRNNLEVQIGFYLDIAHPKKNGKCPVKIRITHISTTKYLKTNYSCLKENWLKVFEPGARNENKRLREDLQVIETRVKDIIAGMPVFNWTVFVQKYQGRAGKELKDYFEEYISSLKKNGQLKTADIYSLALKSLLNHSPALSFGDITIDWLNRYERFMIGKSTTTMSMYIRCLRTIINLAREDGITVNYPFGRRKYVIPAARNIKKALTKEQIEQVKKYAPANNNEATAKDYWLFSYYANGINFKDMALLTRKNIHGNIMVIERAKTMRTNRANPMPIKIFILPEMKDIMKRHQGDKYLFPILTGADPEQQNKDIHQFIKTTNKWMKRIGNKLEFEMPLTTYVARHSLATALKRAGAADDVIGEMLGHGNPKTTKNYLDSLDVDKIQEWAEKL